MAAEGVHFEVPRTMRLKGIDTPCIMMGCRFGDVLELTWKGPEQP